MKAASLKEIQQELAELPKQDLVAICLRLGRFKKENKELLTYLLFEAFDQEAWVAGIKKDMAEQFEEMNRTSLYFVRKSLRKILRTISKFSRYAGLPGVEIQLLLHFFLLIRANDININASAALQNLYVNQEKKIRKLIAGMHEDLQFDFLKELDDVLILPGKTSVAKKIISYFQEKKHAKIKEKKASS